MAGEAQRDDVEVQAFRKFTWVEALVSVAGNLFKWGGLVLIARYTYLAIVALSGTTTIADIGLGFRLFADIRVSQVLSWLLTVGGIGYGLSERQLRRRTIKRLQGRIIEGEKRIDPERTSSRLTARGETNLEDK